SLANAPALTLMAALVFGVLVPSSASEAVNVWPPPVFRVTLKVLVPPTRAALAGIEALGSEDVIEAESVIELTRFQFAVGDGVEAEPVHPEVEPEAEDAEHRLLDLGIVVVEV